MDPINHYPYRSLLQRAITLTTFILSIVVAGATPNDDIRAAQLSTLRAQSTHAAGHPGKAMGLDREAGFTPLFPTDGSPDHWSVRRWNDVRLAADADLVWTVRDGVLHGSSMRGTWLISDRVYGDFVLRYDFKLGPRGNSGCALRAPYFGDPAFDGMELQMADLRYNTQAKASELTGGIYRAIAPLRQVYRPTEWNSVEITLDGARLRVILNGVLVQDVDLDRQMQTVKRHNGSDAPPVKDRPRRGHLGFQELSRGGDHVQIRNARIKLLE